MPRKERYAKRLALGLCCCCGTRPASEGRTKCGRCLYNYSMYRKKYYQDNKEKMNLQSKKTRMRYKSNGWCPICGHTLHPEADAGCVTCINCREGVNR